MSDEQKNALTEMIRRRGGKTEVVHSNRQTSATEGSAAPFDTWQEVVDGDGTVPGLVYYVDANGVLKRHWTVNTAGVMPVTEASGATIAGNTGYTQYVYLAANGPQISTMTAAQLSAVGGGVHHIGRVAVTCAGGAFNNLILVADPGTAHYPVCKIKYILDITAGVAAGATLTFESPAGTALTVAPTITLPALVQGTLSNALDGFVVWQGTDNEALVVDGAGFGAVDDLVIFYEYWYET